MTRFHSTLMLCALACGLLLSLVTVASDELLTVAEFDSQRYLGRWHQIALLPNRFQAKCVDQTTADYARGESGELVVTNQCRNAKSETVQVVGEARVNQKYRDPARLQVRFAPRWLSWLDSVWGDYWVISVDPDYQTALVGSPDRRFLWILARQPSLNSLAYAELVSLAKAQGFDIDKLKREPGTVLIRQAD